MTTNLGGTNTALETRVSSTASHAAKVVSDAPVLERALKARHVEMIAIGGIIGAGLFVGSSAAIASVGPAIVLSYVGAGLLVLMVMRMLTEMAMAFPTVQSFPEFSRLGLGNWAGFMSGWLYWYFWIVVVAVEALAGAVIIREWLPGLNEAATAVALTIVLAGTNLFSTRSYGEAEFILSSVKVAAIIAFLVIAVAWLFGLGNSQGDGFANLTAHSGFMPKGPFSVLAGITTVIFSLVGAEIATIAAAESHASARTLARMTGTVAARILVFYVLSILVIVSIVPWTSIVPGSSPFVAALAAIGIPGGATIMNAVVLVAVLSCLNSGIYVTSRVLFSLAGRGDAPQAITRLGARSVPRRAILISTFMSLICLAFAILSPDRGFAFLVNASGTLILLLYALIALSQINLRNRLDETGETPAIYMWAHPWASIATIAAIAAILAAMAIDEGLRSQFLASMLLTAGVAVAFWIRKAYRVMR